MAYSTRPLRTQLISLYYLLLLVLTMLFVIGMPELIVAGRVLWGLYDAGQRAVFLVLALSPVLLMGAVAIRLLWFAWPRAAAREIAEAAAAQGWQTSRELPSGVKLPSTPLPLPVRRPWVARNVVRAVVQGNDCLAFEVRWIERLRRRRLAVFLGPVLPRRLPALRVQPSSVPLTGIELESEEFNRAFDVTGADRRYVVDMLHPRTMQALLDARSGLVVEGDALAGYREDGLDAASLRSGLTTVAGVAAGIPGHVLERWGTGAGSPQTTLRFAGRTWSRTVLGGMLLSLGASAGLLSVTLAACLAAAAAEDTLTPPVYSTTTLITVAAVLAAIAAGCGALDRLLARRVLNDPAGRADPRIPPGCVGRSPT